MQNIVTLYLVIISVVHLFRAYVIILHAQEHSMLKYQRAWLSSINKGYNPNKPNKLKVYASIKK